MINFFKVLISVLILFLAFNQAKGLMDIEIKEDFEDEDKRIMEIRKRVEERAEKLQQDLKSRVKDLEQRKTNDIRKEKKVNLVEVREAKDIFESLPKGKFLNLSPGEEISEEKEILFEVEGASQVELYLRKPTSLTKIYGGSFEREEGNLWKTELKAKNFPSGPYVLEVKIFNTDLKQPYWGTKIKVWIKNIPKEKDEKARRKEKQLKEQLEKVEDKEEEVKEELEKVKEEIKKVIAKQKEELEKEEKVKEVLEELEEEVSKVSKEAKEVLEREKEKVPELLTKSFEKKRREVEEKLSKVLSPQEQIKVKLATQAIENLIRATEQRLKEDLRELENLEKELLKDSDQDGIIDKEELRLGTDPFNPDTDQDGILDSSELEEGLDPLNPSLGAKIKFEDPRKAKIPPSPEIKIEKVEVIEIPEKQTLGLRIEGKALPFTFVTLHIFSPLIVIARADAYGNWSYILDKDLEDGVHQVFATINKGSGEIDKISEPFEFIKRGKEIVRIFGGEASLQRVPAIEKLEKSFILLISSLIFFSLGLALTLIGVFLNLRQKRIRL